MPSTIAWAAVSSGLGRKHGNVPSAQYGGSLPPQLPAFQPLGGAWSVVHAHRIFFRTALLTFFSSATMTPRPEEALVSSWHDGDIAFTAAGISLLPRFVV